MRDFPGAPGTYLFLVVKCPQLLLSACVTVWLLVMSMGAAHHYNYYLPGFRFSTTRFSLFAIMSMLMFAATVLIFLTCLVAYYLAAKKVAVGHELLGVLAATDWYLAKDNKKSEEKRCGTTFRGVAKLVGDVGLRLWGHCLEVLSLGKPKGYLLASFVASLSAFSQISATISLAVASVLVSALMDYPDDLICVSEAQCRILKLLSVAAFISWSANALSHLITLWFMAGGV